MYFEKATDCFHCCLAVCQEIVVNARCHWFTQQFVNLQKEKNVRISWKHRVHSSRTVLACLQMSLLSREVNDFVSMNLFRCSVKLAGLARVM